MSFIGKTIVRFAAARRRQRDNRAISEMPDYLLADVGFTRDWRGDLQKLPAGFLR